MIMSNLIRAYFRTGSTAIYVNKRGSIYVALEGDLPRTIRFVSFAVTGFPIMQIVDRRCSARENKMWEFDINLSRTVSAPKPKLAHVSSDEAGWDNSTTEHPSRSATKKVARMVCRGGGWLAGNLARQTEENKKNRTEKPLFCRTWIQTPEPTPTHVGHAS
jgi:hypothetical protein